MYFSWLFWFFVFSVVFLHSRTRGQLQNAVLLIGSYIFYAYFDWRFLALLVLATLATYVIGLPLKTQHRWRRSWLYVGLLLNLALLGFFKYTNFFVDIVSTLLLNARIIVSIPTLNILLPLGLSFYVFRLMGYLLDVYNQRIASIPSCLDFAVYIAFFPQISSGPIERASRFLPRLQTTRLLSQQQLVEGATYILLGVFYKTSIADPLVFTTDTAFKAIAELSSSEALKAMILYSIRLYADFAGYSSIAIGISTWFALPAMENFRQPYFAPSIIQFWTRWHISLSTWFRDYLFFPLSRSLVKRWGNQHSASLQTGASFLTMLATGIWHGANWTFLFWGALHGFYMLLERVIARFDPPNTKTGSFPQYINQLANFLITQLALAVGWVFFAAPSLPTAFLFFDRLFSEKLILTQEWFTAVLIPIGQLLLIDFLQLHSKDIMTFWQLRLVWRAALLALLCMLLILFGGVSREPFIYFRF